MKHWRAKIYGIVQGVGYRWFAISEAQKLGIEGYVRNLGDGSVEVNAQGDSETLDDFLEVLRRGPMMGKVAKIELVRFDSIDDEFSGKFEVRY